MKLSREYIARNKFYALPVIIVVLILAIGGTYYWLTHQPNAQDQAQQGSGENNDDLNGDRPGRVTFKNLGPAPEFKKIDQWLNGDAQAMSALQNKVVLVYFWTYSCNSCITSIADINKWDDAYRDQGFVTVGIHTPQYVFEKNPDNVQPVIDRFKINFPVGLDNAYATWTAYKNQFWPAFYLVDKSGKIMYTHYGDGGLKTTEKAIRLLLGLETDPLSPVATASDPNRVKSPTMPLGLKHLDFFANETVPTDKERRYKVPPTLELNTVALEGKWRMEAEKIITTQPGAKIHLKFDAAKVYLKANSKAAMSLKVTIDGNTQLPVNVEGNNVYTLFDTGDYGEHILEIEIPAAGFEAMQFSFG